MSKRDESFFAEVAVDQLVLDAFGSETSAYYKNASDIDRDELFDKFQSRLRWHLARSLSPRQKEVMRLYLMGKKQREIGALLGIKQQVVSIYKTRAIKRLRELLLK